VNVRIRKHVSAILLISIATAFHAAQAADSDQAAPAADDQKSSTSTPVSISSTAVTGTADLDEIVVHGIRRGDLIMPTTVTSDSAFGLDLGVMDTPRNNTVLSKAQLDALDVQNPAGFSYLTSSAYSDASFGEPNVPRIRGQYADMFYNGMRDAFTSNGYGAPMSFNMVDSIDIVKGPASVQGGPGAGVGGSINITTKMPSLTKFTADATLELDTQQKRIASFDIGGPLTSSLSGLLAFTSNDSGSYYYDMFLHQQSVYGALLWQVNSAYTVSLNGSFIDDKYRENDGINRANQGLIDNSTYLTGAPDPADIVGFGTLLDFTGSTVLNRRTLIDEAPGTAAHSQHAMLQLIQTWQVSDKFSVVNNTFYNYLNRYNQTMDYFADGAQGDYTLENKTDFKVDFDLGSVKSQIDAGFSYRYAHMLSIQDYNSQPISVFDLSQDPSTWVTPGGVGAASGGDAWQFDNSGAVPYVGAFGHVQYGVSSNNDLASSPNQSVDSNLQDLAIFLEHRLTLSPQWSVLYGVRADLVQLNDSDPLFTQTAAAIAAQAAQGNDYSFIINGDPQSQHTAWYGLYNGNISVVYSPTDWVSAYATYNKAQYTLSNDQDGAVNTLGLSPVAQLRQQTLLEEGGLKFDLLGKALFASIAGFHQERTIPLSGYGGVNKDFAHINGGEFELNYQPDSHVFGTLSYSYLRTTLDAAESFYNYPAQPGTNLDGEGFSTVFVPGQNFQDPGLPKHLFNALLNYKLGNGLGFQANVQVTSPIDITQSGLVDANGTVNSALGTFGPTGGLSYLGLTPAQITAALPAAIRAACVATPGMATCSPGTYVFLQAPRIPWQYTINLGMFYNFLGHYTVKLEAYNLTNQRNLTNDVQPYGNDFLTVGTPRSFDLTLSAKL
jgi:catecholate siderophore receptor